LILEDDVIGTAAGIEQVKRIMSELPPDAFLVCGGQEGLRGQRFNYGAPTRVPGVYKVPRIAKKFFTRACCYCVTRESAQVLLGQQERRLGVSDNWGKYFDAHPGFYFCGIFQHPIDLTGSYIERERLAKRPRTEIGRIRDDGIGYVLGRFFSKVVLRCGAPLFGLRLIE
jgi:glycosyl transferase family 25